jgi:hypothetical protein
VRVPKKGSFLFRTCNRANWGETLREKGLLAIVCGCKYFRQYLYGRKFTIVTDHRPLTWIFNVKDPSSTLLRWRLKLEEYEYEVVYKKGSTTLMQTLLAEYMSRKAALIILRLN